MKRRVRPSLVLIFLLFLFIPNVTFCQTNTWTGSTDNSWHKACNWSLNSIPTCAQDVTVPNTVTKPVVTNTAHCKTLTIDTDAGATVTVNSTGSGVIYIGSGGGTCSGTPTDLGGCNCTNLTYQYYSSIDPGLPECDFFGGTCGSNCQQTISCDICRTPVWCVSFDCMTLCGTDCGGWDVYTYNP